MKREWERHPLGEQRKAMCAEIQQLDFAAEVISKFA